VSAVPTLVLVPGLVCDRAVWEPVIAELGVELRIHVADHGELDSLAGMAGRILDEVTGPLAIAGHSMGGRVALELVRLAPRRVLGAALMDTGCLPLPDGDAGRREAEGRWRLADLARREGMRAMAHDWVQQMVYAERLTDRPLIETILDMFARKTPAIFAAQTRAMIGRPDATTVLDQLTCPTLVMCGREDNWAPAEHHREMAAHVRGSRLVIVPRCGHMSTLERASEVAEALRQWLDAVGVTGAHGQ
jgi:pimeloyl-ACP methyl ester carboxylesterase